MSTAWTRLWLVLPSEVRTEVQLAFAQWHRACVWASWAVLYAGLAGLWWPAAVPAAALAVLAWTRGRAATAYRAALVEATFDMYGPRLADATAVRLTPPGRLTPLAGEDINARIAKGA